MRILSRLSAGLLILLLLAAVAEAEIRLDPAPDRSRDQAALQRGARVFIEYCLNCHPASLMRYNRLLDIGFTEQQVRDEFLHTNTRIGDLMMVAMDRKDATRWFGTNPPDLSLIVRASTSSMGPGEDWVYAYLRGFYRDPSRPSGWNNVMFRNVAMHHVLWEFQGEQVLGADKQLTLAKPGKLSAEQYDDLVGDLVAFLKYMSEPTASKRRHVGIYVLSVMGLLLFFSIIIKPSRRKPVQQQMK